MDIGIALPTMCRGYDRAATVEWSRLADEGPVSSISCGERMTYHNPEMWTTMAAAAAVTERVRIFANLSVLPAHPVPLVAKQAATIDVLSEGRFTLGVGVGGRGGDYRSLGADSERRHERLDRSVAELRSLWAGEPPFDGADPVGPPCVQPGGPPVLAGALGPKSLARAAQWADGVVSFSVGGVPGEIAWSADAARRAWTDADRATPRLVSGCFYTLGIPDAETILHSFTAEYLDFLGSGNATAAAAAMKTYDTGALHRTLDAAEAAGLDEFILVPGSADRAVLDATLKLIAAR